MVWKKVVNSRRLQSWAEDVKKGLSSRDDFFIGGGRYATKDIQITRRGNGKKYNVRVLENKKLNWKSLGTGVSKDKAERIARDYRNKISKVV